jgi:diguanylate cyclase (GGDEF)-like protein/PAS domain S-box-containing protein
MSKSSKDARKTRIFLDTIIDNLPMMVTVIDARSQRFVLANKATETVFGKARNVIGKSLHELLPKAKADELYARDRAIIRAGQRIELDYNYTRSNGDDVILSAKMIPIRIHGGDVEYLLSIHEDITENRLTENKMLFMAHYDCLTGVGNRSLFRLQIREAFECHKYDTVFALIYLDLDNFKSINDSLGHPVGDQVLISIAQRLLEVISEPHHVARLGGDEFAIILKGVPSLEAIKSTISRIISVISLPIDACGNQVFVTASIGVAVAPDDANDADALLRNADIALYRAKKDGGNTYEFFEIRMLKDFQERRAMENDLRDALDNNEFKLYYQPLIGLDHHHVNGFEALLRWDSPSRGLVSPADFIPLAEETGNYPPPIFGHGFCGFRPGCRGLSERGLRP